MSYKTLVPVEDGEGGELHYTRTFKLKLPKRMGHSPTIGNKMTSEPRLSCGVVQH